MQWNEFFSSSVLLHIRCSKLLCCTYILQVLGNLCDPAKNVLALQWVEPGPLVNKYSQPVVLMVVRITKGTEDPRLPLGLTSVGFLTVCRLSTLDFQVGLSPTEPEFLGAAFCSGRQGFLPSALGSIISRTKTLKSFHLSSVEGKYRTSAISGLVEFQWWVHKNPITQASAFISLFDRFPWEFWGM